jgi:hypothetical protein
MLEAQAWRAAVVQHLVASIADKAGLKAYDPEILHMLRTSPPASLAGAPEFQTDGKFDQQKYMSAISDPRINWAPFEEVIASQLPGRKLEERLAASLKLSQHELFATFHDRYDLVAATAVHVPPITSGTVPPVTDADIDSVFQRYRNRMSGAARVQLEVLRSPKTYSDEDLRAARSQAQSLAERRAQGRGLRRASPATTPKVPARVRAARSTACSRRPSSARIWRRRSRRQQGRRDRSVRGEPATSSWSRCWTGGDARLTHRSAVQDRADPDPDPDELTRRGARSSRSSTRCADRAKTIGLGKAATEGGLATTKTNYFDYATGPPELAGRAGGRRLGGQREAGRDQPRVREQRTRSSWSRSPTSVMRVPAPRPS